MIEDPWNKPRFPWGRSTIVALMFAAAFYMIVYGVLKWLG